MNSKDTVVVNLFAGPSTGKSVLAARLFSEISIGKPFGEAALCQEYAKLLVYTGEIHNATQEEITAGQLSMLEPLLGNVDIVVTDSPIELGYVYGGSKVSPRVSEMIEAVHAKSKSINFFVERIGSLRYQEEGRVHNLDEAVRKDAEILDMLKKREIPYTVIKNEYDIASVISKMSTEIAEINRILRCNNANAEENPSCNMLRF